MQARLTLTAGMVAGALVAGMALAPNAAAMTAFNYSSSSGASVKFTGTGDTFEFLPNAPGPNFEITLTTAGPSLNGLMGTITGTYTIGAISTPAAGVEEAPVTGMGSFIIDDGAGFSFTADLVWDKIQTSGTGGTINVAGVANMTNLAYGGSNAGLIQLASFLTGTNVVTFQFIPGKTLTELTTDGTMNSTSFSGSVSAVPIPAALPLFLTALAGLGVIGYRRSQAA